MATVSVLNTTANLSGKTLCKLEDSQTIVGAKTFDLGASAPFICVSGAAVVTHLDADKLDGQHAPAGTIVGTTDAQTLSSKTIVSPIMSGTWTGAPTFSGNVIFSGVPQINAGLKFPATSIGAGDANTLYDYETGTWTPGFAFGGGTTNLTYSSQVGTYTKIGALVWVTGRVVLTNNGDSTGAFTFTGLPFALVATHFPQASMSFYQNMATFTNCGGYGVASGTTIQIVLKGAVTSANADDTNTGNSSDLIVSLTYRTSE